MSANLSTIGNLVVRYRLLVMLAGVLIFGLVGFVAYRRGKKAGRPRTKWLGVALMLYPYLTAPTLPLYLVGAALCLALYLDRDRGTAIEASREP